VKIESKGKEEGFNFLKVILLISRGLGLIGRNKNDNKIK
jgi:hypothetical protein